MNERAVKAMVRMEVSRATVSAGKVTVWAVPACLVAWRLGWISPRAVGLILGIVGVAWASSSGTTFFMDKLNGTMELLSALPVPPKDLAWARVIVCAIVAVPGAAFLTLAAGVAAPWSELGLPVPRALAALLPALWVGGTVVSSLMLGLGMRVSPRWGLLAVYGTLMGVFYVAAEIFKRVPNAMAILRSLLESGWLPTILAGGVLVAAALLLALAHALMVSAIRRFDPGLDRIEI